MKIKCPVEDCGMDLKSEWELLKHLLSYSNEKDKITYIKNYARLLFKIHQKIQTLNNNLKVDGGQYYCINSVNYMIAKELKSLLENK